jgi:hypothetical protein
VVSTAAATKTHKEEEGGAVVIVAVSARGMNFQIPANEAAHHHVREVHGTDSWRYRSMELLHSTKIQIFLMSLLLLDVLILFVELFLLAQYPHGSLIERDGISCCPVIITNTSSDNQNLAEVCDVGITTASSLPPYAAAGCDERKWPVVHAMETLLFATTVTILSIFMIELNVSMIALGPGVFFRQFFFALDYVIITVSITLDVAFYVLQEDIYQSLAGVLVLVRIWRFVRIGHGLIEITNEYAHHEHSQLVAYAEALEELCTAHNIVLPDRIRASSLHPDDSSEGGTGGKNILFLIVQAEREKNKQLLLSEDTTKGDNAG